MSNVVIKDVQAFITSPRGINLVVVKVQTNVDGLCGYGCATFTWRCLTVVSAVQDYLKPLLIGKSVDNIEDLWQLMMSSSYWRNGPVLNNAISGVDEALWDIKGKMAGMPVYDLLGGKCRTGIAVYRHAAGSTIDEVEKNVQEYLDEGYHYIRCQYGNYGGNDNSGGLQSIKAPDGSPDGAYFDPEQYIRNTTAMFRQVRKDFGDEIEFLHDVHERLDLADAIRMAKQMEEFHLFFLEDLLSPEQITFFKVIREQTCVPIAMGELYVSPLEWLPVVKERWIDYFRAHISDIGGITPARKAVAVCEAFGVRTALHGPGDTSPIGMAAEFAIDISVPNFGIQEFSGFTDEEREVFPGCPEVRNGYVYINDKPGLGVGFDEKAAEKYPFNPNQDAGWTYSRLPDGTMVRP